MFVKVCGLKEPVHVEQAVSVGADAIGFVLTPSPRFILPPDAKKLTDLVPDSVLTVGVFKNESTDQMIERATIAGVKAVQVHGSREAEELLTIHNAGFILIRAVPFTQIEEPLDFVDYYLVDAPRPGSGESWDYGQLLGKMPSKPWLLAGGLSPKNVATAIEQAEPFGVDVSSGIEIEAGKKSTELITDFIRTAKAVNG